MNRAILDVIDCAIPEWGPSRRGVRLDAGFHSKAEREQHRRFMRPPAGISQEERTARRAYLESIGTWACPERMGKRERAATPIPFRDVLIGIAESGHALSYMAQRVTA